MVPVKHLQAAISQDRRGKKESSYIFILCHMTKQGICVNSGHKADTAMLEAITCTVQTRAVIKQTDWVLSALTQMHQDVLGRMQQSRDWLRRGKSRALCEVLNITSEDALGKLALAHMPPKESWEDR